MDPFSFNLQFCVTVPLSIISIWSGYYFLFVVEKPKITCGNQKLRKFLTNHVPSSTSSYYPPWLFWGGRMQSILGISNRDRALAKNHLDYKRELLQLKDGGELALDFLESEKDSHGNRLTVLFMPGLTSSSRTSYVQSLCKAVNDAGANVVVFNNRGLGGVLLKTPRTFCAVNIEDLIEAISYLKNKFPGEKFLALGTSFGSLLLSQYCTKYPTEAKQVFLGGLFISSVLDAVASSASIETTINRIVINRAFCDDLIQRSKRFQPVLQGQNWFDIDKIVLCKTIRDYDVQVTCPQFGFKTVLDYYEQSTTVYDMHKITIPVIVFNACDDPIQPGKYLPYEEAKKSSSKLALVTTRRGGHLGFLESILYSKSSHFVEKFTKDFVEAVRKHGEEFKMY